MNKDKEKFWKALREPTHHNCRNCIHLVDQGCSLDADCIKHRRFRFFTEGFFITEDYWEWNGVDER